MSAGWASLGGSDFVAVGVAGVAASGVGFSDIVFVLALARSDGSWELNRRYNFFAGGPAEWTYLRIKNIPWVSVQGTWQRVQSDRRFHCVSVDPGGDTHVYLNRGEELGSDYAQRGLEASLGWVRNLIY